MDKTLFIKEWWESRDAVTLITRPRRFGKTLNMNMLERFWSLKYRGEGDIFQGLDIWKEEKYRLLQGTYPVISLSFAGVKETNYASARRAMNYILLDLYTQHDYLRESDTLTEKEKIYFESVSPEMNEVEQMFEKMISDWFEEDRFNYNRFVKALLEGDVEAMNYYMENVAETMFSSFDVGNRPSAKTNPERFYHGFVLGLLVDLKGRYLVTSNRESGFGRYDVMLEPLNKDDDGIILEFKVHNPKKEENMEKTVRAALLQIEEKQYEQILLDHGIGKERIRKYGFAFQGKEVLIG